jgi:glycosyltransferase involved in cell wall biosynthesis
MGMIIAAMPAFNEEAQIAKLVLQAQQHVDTVVVVDDGSTDTTAAIAQRLGAHVVTHDKNKGYGGALRTCFKTARELDADMMVILDSDGQHDPAYIPQFLTCGLLHPRRSAGRVHRAGAERHQKVSERARRTRMRFLISLRLRALENGS